jgi:hypothetical protein
MSSHKAADGLNVGVLHDDSSLHPLLLIKLWLRSINERRCLFGRQAVPLARLTRR